MNPTPPKHIEAARNFLRLSIEDLQIAESIPKHVEGRNRMVCFLSQQAAEKALKAALASGCGCKEEVPRTSLSIAKTAVFSIKEDCASIGIEAPTLTNRRRSEYTP